MPKTLRAPWAKIGAASSAVSSTVNAGIDGFLQTNDNVAKSIMANKYVKAAGQSITSIHTGVEGKVAPYAAKAKPYVQPVVPYVEAAKPYVPPAMLALLVVCTPPVLCVLGFVAFITAPVWLTVGFLTAFIWIPALIFATISAFFLAVVCAIRYFSNPPGNTVLKRIWRNISSTTWGKKIFFVNA
mmetsp:Transcript_19941/g.49862  ORF Transcript_19941/g.49862 Transcript_19941/m.49862 type:complete len:185 (-) Transcript_19941:299-853(-)|eukprot:CAMPEP_0173421964 /NCGR_PEP_ID=MMETSP1357-20121228/2857_1 /TAXON_ID=77926 /ORGANISM="Hemiselmis rufescens, Strain PCC563" /LENGTH=184 /DNA_ID=CAMNT_0014384931 /DNA_START=11 /DNA_END=565 /DNA_ORIENTATION=-